MPSPIVASDFQISNFSGDVCESIRKLLEVNDRMRQWFEWAFNPDGTATSAFKLEFQDVAVAPGAIIFMPAENVPDGYLVCNGQAVSRTVYINLFSIIGTDYGEGDGEDTFNLPDLRGKFLIGASSIYPVKSTGGAATVTLTVAQLGKHKHAAWAGALRWLGSGAATTTSGSQANAQGTHVNDIETAEAGGDQPHENLPPYSAGHWLIKH